MQAYVNEVRRGEARRGRKGVEWSGINIHVGTSLNGTNCNILEHVGYVTTMSYAVCRMLWRDNGRRAKGTSLEVENHVPLLGSASSLRMRFLTFW